MVIVVRQRALYLWTACLLPSVVILLQYVAPLEPTVRGQNLAVLAGILGGTLVLMLWALYTRTGEWPRLMLVFLLVIFTAWLTQSIVSLLDGYRYNYTTFLLPLVILLLLFKPVSKEDMFVGLLVLGYGLVLVFVISLVLGGKLGIPDGFASPESGESRLPFISELIGIDTRWGGPLSSVNLVTAAGGLLVMTGIFVTRLHRIIFVTVGLIVVLLGQGRTSLVALGVALVVLGLWGVRCGGLRYAVAFRATVISGLAALLVIYVWLADSSLNGRTSIWADYLQLFGASPITGVGFSGINQYVEQARLDNPGAVVHDHAHSIYLDGLIRYGLVWLVLTIAVFGLALFISWRARGSSISSRPLALVVYVSCVGLTETVFSWAYASMYVIALLLVVGLASLSRLRPESNTSNDAQQREPRTEYSPGPEQQVDS